MVRTLRCGRSNPGSNPGLGNLDHFFFRLFLKNTKFCCIQNVCLIYLFFCIRIKLDTYYFCIGKCLKVRSESCLFSLTTIAKKCGQNRSGPKKFEKVRTEINSWNQFHEIFTEYFPLKLITLILLVILNSKLQIRIKIWPAVPQNKNFLDDVNFREAQKLCWLYKNIHYSLQKEIPM